MATSKQPTPVFLSLLEEAVRSLETHEPVTRDEARRVSREAARELAAERAVRARPRGKLDSVAKRTQTSFADIEVAAPIPLPTTWNDGPFAVDECRAEPKLAS